jgi:ketosteroid isomerase-like protein
MPATSPAYSGQTTDDVEIVRAFLHASMKPDAERAASFIGANFTLTFTGGRTYDHPSGSIGFNAKRYRWVKKSMDRFDVVPGTDETIVYSIGTLYGEWPDGTAFKDNRYVDRFVVRDGKIVRMDVWNDSAERILVRNGIDA